MSFTVLPAVDISNGRCVRVLQGHFGSEAVYSDHPADVAQGLSRAGARWLHVVDLDGARSGVSRNRALVLEAIRSASCPVQAGGGLTSLDDVEEVLAAGASRAVLGARALEDEAELAKACSRYGERIALTLDARASGSEGWTVATGMSVPEAVARAQEAGINRFIYTDVSRDGTLAGPDVAALLEVAHQTAAPVLAAGGISSLADLRTVAMLASSGIAGAIVGRALYEGKFTVDEANRAAEEASDEDFEEPLLEP